MATPLEIELDAAGSAPVIVILKPAAAAAAGGATPSAALAAANPKDLKDCFLKSAETIGGAIAASLKAAATAVGAKAAALAIKSPPAMRVFGTMAASTTLIQGVHFIEEKYSAAALVSSSVMPLAMAIMTFVLPLRESALLRAPFLKSAIVCMK